MTLWLTLAYCQLLKYVTYLDATVLFVLAI
jgi:hypothetical protein